jgi:hydrogenase-1 operon protein HyaF
MKAGFWVAPEGEEAVVSMLQVETEVPVSVRGATFLKTNEADALIRRCPLTAALLPQLAEALKRQRADANSQLFDITDWSGEERRLIGEALGEGEVGGVAVLPSGVTAQIQETVFAGLWRVRFTSELGALVGDYLEVGAYPQAVREACRGAVTDFEIGAPPADAMNVMPVLVEVRDRLQTYQAGDAAHVLNFSLFPMSPGDMAFLQTTLGVGPIRLVSRGYGCCRIVATAARNVWSVQFTNSMDAVVLDTLEIVDIPEALRAADEDFQDSAERLAEVEDAYFK